MVRPEWLDPAVPVAAVVPMVVVVVETAAAVAAAGNLCEKPGFRVEYGRLDQADKNW